LIIRGQSRQSEGRYRTLVAPVKLSVNDPDERAIWWPPKQAANPPGKLALLGAFAAGALAVGAVAIGALAIGRLAIGRMAIGRGDLGDLRIGRLMVGHLLLGRSGNKASERTH
jgi:hypothetical protein